MERVGPTLQEVLAENIRRVRQEEGLRQDEVAGKARSAGLQWTSVTVATIETGQRDVAAEELLLLPIVFDRPLSDFIATEADVIRVSDTAAVLPKTLQAVVSGEWDSRPLPARRAIPYLSERLDKRIVKAIRSYHLEENHLTYFLVAEGRRGEAERKAAQTLKSDATTITAASIALYGRDLTTERDSRAEDGATEGQDRRAVRGHVTRRLLSEIKEALVHPEKVKPKRISAESAEERVGVIHDPLRKTPLDVDPTLVFNTLVKTYAGLDRMDPKDWSQEHRVTIKKRSRKGSP